AFLICLILIALFKGLWWQQVSLHLRAPDSHTYIIGLALPGTSSRSFACALQRLGFVSYQFPLRFEQKPELYKTRCDALLDWVTLGFRPLQLAQLFPDAVFIHTTREVQSWICSMQYLRKLLLLCPKIRCRFDAVFGTEQNWPS